MNPIRIPQARILIDAYDAAQRNRWYLAVGRDAIQARALVRSGHLEARRDGGFMVTVEGRNWVMTYSSAMLLAARYHYGVLAKDGTADNLRLQVTGTIRNLFRITRKAAYVATLLIGTTNASILEAVTTPPPAAHGRPGRLCFADFAGGVEWSVRQVDDAYVVYRGTEVDSRHAYVQDAYNTFRSHCPDRGFDLESSLSH